MELAAELATVIEQRVHGDFQQVADVMAQLVNDTALTADEAGRLALNLSKAMERVKPGMAAAALPEVSRLVGGYESALKRLGGQAGMVEQWLTKLTTPQGLLAAGALGIPSPEFIRTEQGIEAVMQNFGKYAESFLRNAQGIDRQWRLDALGEQMGMTADQITMLIQVIKEQGAETTKEISLRERFKQQIGSTGEGIVRLGNTLLGLLEGALYPVIRALNVVINALNETVEWIFKWKPALVGAMVATGVGAVALVWRLRHVAAAFWDVMVASRAAEISLRIQARSNLANQLLLPGFGRGAAAAGAGTRTLSVLATSVPRLLASIGGGISVVAHLVGRALVFLGPIGWALAAATVVLGYFYNSWRKAVAEEKSAKDRLAVAQRGFSGRGAQSLVDQFRYSSLEWMRMEGATAVERWLRTSGLDMQGRYQVIADVDRALYTRGRYERSPYRVGINPQEQKMLQVWEDIKKVLATGVNLTTKEGQERAKTEEDKKVLQMQQLLRSGAGGGRGPAVFQPVPWPLTEF